MAAALLTSLASLTARLLSASSSSFRAGNPAAATAAVAAELQNLRAVLGGIRALLADAEERETREESVMLWLLELRQVAFDADDILSDFDHALLRSPPPDRNSRKRKHCQDERTEQEDYAISFPPHPPPVLDASFARDILKRIKEVMARFDGINRDRTALRLREEDGPAKPETQALPRQTTSAAADLSRICGREEEKRKIISAMLNGGEKKVVSIVAMGGMGKTTLAKLVYNDGRVEKQFGMRCWVWVSQSCDERALLKAIIENASCGGRCDLTEISDLLTTLNRLIARQRFLLVLDDVWDAERIGLTAILDSVLSAGADGSAVLITTRNEAVAAVAAGGAQLMIKLGGLSTGHCWELFCRCAFGDGGRDPPPELAATAEPSGVPLVVAVVAGMLYLETRLDYWDEVLNNVVWDFEEAEESVLRVLRLSYKNLPAPLKPCFSYCALFPKGHLFEMDCLVRMWVAQGFIQVDDLALIEETGREYVFELMQRSLFQRYAEHIAVDECYFAVHDLIHDLARTILGTEAVTAELEASTDANCTRFCTTSSSYVRHLSATIGVETRLSQLTLEPDCKPDALRSFLIWSGNRTSYIPKFGAYEILLVLNFQRDLFEKPHMQYLRVLDLSICKIPELPESIGGLKHLRYLGLACTDIKRLPRSVSNLCYLQTLDLRYCERLVELPSDISRLTNLRHLVHGVIYKMLDGPVISISKMPAGIGRLSALQTLPLFLASRESGSAGVDELKELNDLRGELVIAGLQCIRGKRIGEAKKAELNKKKHITYLIFRWDLNYDDFDKNKEGSSQESQFKDDEDVLESLRPHISIRTLEIERYAGSRFPSWMVDISFENLVQVRLVDCNNCTYLPALGQLPSLRELEMLGMNKITRIGEEFFGDKGVIFPSLQRLLIMGMHRWEEWSFSRKEREILPRLHELSIVECRKITSLSLYDLGMLKKFRVSYCGKLEKIDGLESCLVAIEEKGRTSNRAGLAVEEKGRTTDHAETSRSAELREVGLSERQRLPAALEYIDIDGCPLLPKISIEPHK
ncbi:putative disease resistance RPP13-like protein 1 [Ananas comosus]|uniref:Putative disease resistance RPP13-like protein 1 n=1 Tax=Ananas comosus TaxID=4615 RepID=A0A199VTD3_ANACO|nr:putative disease resistance RPP13-like protein 1 [Ananas comosus]